ncbi:MAG: AAA family ATPase [Bacteroidetes bacterium]|nr:AAA family ATPase [Bacteroidota bacterium]
MMKDYIYSKEGVEILYCINKALLSCINLGKDNAKLIPENPELIDCFSGLLKNESFDNHITEGLFPRHQERGEKVYPRILKLTINSFKDASEVSVRSRFVIPSPLHILYYSLIAPENSQTAAYSLASCRTLLFNLLEKTYSFNRGSSKQNNLLNSIEEENISQAVDSFKRHIKISRSWPKDVNKKSPIFYINELVGHLMAMKGVAHLSFNSQGEARKFLHQQSRNSFLDQFGKKIITARFRLSNKFEELPETGELINQLYGIPMALKGGEIVFFGGLKPSSSGGLVVGVSGQAGIGKTSFALALANSLAPLKIKCFYLSLEEGENDIKKRLFSLQTAFEKELSFYQNPKDWFFVTKKTKNLSLEDLLQLIGDIKDDLEKNIAESSLEKQNHSIIVIDNLNEYSDGTNYNLIERFVEKARELKSIVILIGGEGVLEKLKMEYLIDIGINLVHEGLGQKGDKPLRLFNLYKTRHQLSRQGTHVFHMSGEEGFRISPQIPSQMDRKEKLKKLLQDESKLINTLNYLNDDKSLIPVEKKSFQHGNNNVNFLNLFPRTHILVHGYGSAGKAGFSLKLLLTPPIQRNIAPNRIKYNNYHSSTFRRKILILSFLYPQKYYHDIINDKIGLQKKINKNYPSLPDPIVEYLIFYPGYISPEDFINKITRKLDKAILEGQPFTGVLIDGLHNVFLQFISLQNNDMVWPLLYNILSRYDLTVVSTFTNFAMNDKLLDDDPISRNDIINQGLPDHLLMQKGMAPFLHALVKAADYYFFLEQFVLKSGERKYLLSVKGAINQNVPTELLEWDKQRSVFIAKYSYEEIRQL